MKVKKIIAPLVIGLLLILYFVGFIIVCFLIDIPLIDQHSDADAQHTHMDSKRRSTEPGRL